MGQTSDRAQTAHPGAFQWQATYRFTRARHRRRSIDSESVMNEFLDAAIGAAREAGKLLRENFGQPLKVNVEEAHDIKLELDVRSQDLITQLLLKRFPDHGILGEEG